MLKRLQSRFQFEDQASSSSSSHTVEESATPQSSCLPVSEKDEDEVKHLEDKTLAVSPPAVVKKQSVASATAIVLSAMNSRNKALKRPSVQTEEPDSQEEIQ